MVALVIVLALFFDFTNGFHDTANAMATPIATGALTPRVAVAIAATLNLVGAFLSTEVARTISGGLIREGDAGIRITPTMIFAGLIGAIMWNLVTWLLGLPSSSSHALFGGLIGAVIVGTGFGAIDPGVLLSKIVFPALLAPFILYDHPTIAAESPGDLYDATEIDEILTLRTLALTDAEKRAARITDPRAAAIIDRVDAMDAMTMDRLHGAIRYLRQVTGESPDDPGVDRRPAAKLQRAEAAFRIDPASGFRSRQLAREIRGERSVTCKGEFDAPPAETAPPPWWDPDADASVSPATDSVVVNGITVRRGSTVRLRPGTRRADAQDMFLVGRPATIAAVLFDIDDQPYFALTLDEDPSAELQRSHGRFLYFTPDEVEPI